MSSAELKKGRWASVEIGHPVSDPQARGLLFARRPSYSWQGEFLNLPEGEPRGEQYPPCRVCGLGIGIRLDSEELAATSRRRAIRVALGLWMVFAVAVLVSRAAPSRPADFVAVALGVVAFVATVRWWTYAPVRAVGALRGHRVRIH